MENSVSISCFKFQDKNIKLSVSYLCPAFGKHCGLLLLFPLTWKLDLSEPGATESINLIQCCTCRQVKQSPNATSNSREAGRNKIFMTRITVCGNWLWWLLFRPRYKSNCSSVQAWRLAPALSLLFCVREKLLKVRSATSLFPLTQLCTQWLKNSVLKNSVLSCGLSYSLCRIGNF